MTVDRTDLYTVLGLSPRATQEQIRRAYRTLMRQNHPDTRPAGDAAHGAAANSTLQHLIAAYAVLADPARRAEYDQRTTPGTRRVPTWVGPAVRLPYDPPGQPPIQASPVRWHHGPG
jgi:curved DNA-binding protein CbpA